MTSMRSFVVSTSVGPDRSITETNAQDNSFYLTACDIRFSNSTAASAKQQHEESA